MGEALTICEVGPRDGLQNESSPIDTAGKLALVGGLIDAGVRTLELTSFVNPRAVPQMADADQLLPAALAAFGAQMQGRETAGPDDAGPDASAGARAALRLLTLVINDKGYERAVAAGSRHINIVVVASETLCLRNNRMSTQESLEAASRLLARARGDRVWARVTVAAAWVCPYDGPTPRERVFRCVDHLAAAGADELAIADTVGHADPMAVGRLLDELGRRVDMRLLAGHFHDTQAMGLANAYAALQAGVRVLDSSVGGLGGCPFAPGAAGNLATEDLVLMAHKMGFVTGIDLDRLWSVVRATEPRVGHAIGGRSRAWYERQAGGESGTSGRGGGI